MSKSLPFFLASTFIFTSAIGSRARALSASEYARRPKLVVVLVIDQFRGDLLTRDENQFLAPGTSGLPGGFRYLMSKGAWIPFAQYDALQDMTCPGHATILSGSRPASHGIGTNDWFNPETKKLTYCTDDEKEGPSPRRLRTTTVGDEMKNARAASRVIAVALKDRAAIMLGGHRADNAVWMDDKDRWTTSPYYGPLPSWASAANEDLKKKPAADFNFDTVKGGIAGTEMTLALALKALKQEKLGRGPAPDLLAISLSNHDLIGHKFGPDSGEVLEMTRNEDRLIASFLKELSKEMKGLDEVIIAFTADHGIPPSVETARASKMDSGKVDFLPAVKKINQRLDAKFGAAGDRPWVLGTRLFHFFLNRELITAKKLKSGDVQAEAKAVLMEESGVATVFTRDEYERGVFPPGTVGEQLKHAYIPDQSGDLIAITKPFFFEKGSNAVTHMTGWSYDRSVPLILVGRPFKPGVYGSALVIDLAPTLTFLMGVLPPAMNEGRVLSETLK